MKVVCVTKVGNMKDPDESKRGTVGILDLPIKELVPDEVLIKVAYCGICGSDPHIVGGCFGDHVPIGIGHEMSGVIVNVGEHATAKGLKVGDRVSGNFLGYCGKCYHCSIGQQEYCTHVGNEPCMAEYVMWNESQVYRVSDDVSLREASLMEPMSIAVRVMDKANMRLGQRVLVSGGGPIGQLCCQLFKKFGAAELTLSEPNAQRREMARRIGAEHTVDPLTENLYDRAMEITQGHGYDVIVEVSAIPSAAESVIRCAAKFATVLYVAQFPNDYNMPLNLFEYCYNRQVTISGIYCAHYNYARTAQYMKYVDLSDFIGDDQVFDIDDVNEAFQVHLSGRYPKVLIRCNKFDGE